VTPIRLGVNVDHVATVRQARLGADPDPVELALLAEKAGADAVVAHLREDRRHVQDHDVARLRSRLRIPLNLEMGLSADVVRIALRVRPAQATFVPERRRELTTEGGLDAAGRLDEVRQTLGRFRQAGIAASLFIDPDLKQVAAAKRAGAGIVELHTGAYANAKRKGPELRHLTAAARAARREGLAVAAGHGLTAANVRAVAAIPEIEELNIGHSIVSRALSIGMPEAVKEMRRAMAAARR
jgi:pyridoxine 5-phosphate synthase